MKNKQLPSFKLLDSNGEWINSSDLPTPLVLFFYPKDNSLVCTQQVCAFRDHFDTFKKAGINVYGVSSDSVKSHGLFSKSYDLPYELLSDPGGKVAKLLGVRKKLGLIPGRVTFIIDQEGKIIHIFDSLLKAEKHVLEALNALGA